MGNKITSRKEDYSKWYNDIVINAVWFFYMGAYEKRARSNV